MTTSTCIGKLKSGKICNKKTKNDNKFCKRHYYQKEYYDKNITLIMCSKYDCIHPKIEISKLCQKHYDKMKQQYKPKKQLFCCIGKTGNNKSCGRKLKKEGGFCKRHSNQINITRPFIVCNRCNHELIFDNSGKSCIICREKNKKYNNKSYIKSKKVENGLKKCLQCKTKKSIDCFTSIDGVFCSECLIVKKEEYKNIEIEHKCYKCNKIIQEGNICELCDYKLKIENQQRIMDTKSLNKILNDENLISDTDYWRNPTNIKKYYGNIRKRCRNNRDFYEVVFKKFGSRSFNNYDDAIKYFKSNPFNQEIKNQYRFIGNNKFIEVKLTQGKTTILDNTPENLELIENNIWCCENPKKSRTCYATLGNSQRMHTLLFQVEKYTVDHINRNGLDNRSQNIRSATKSQQSQNTTEIRINNKSGTKGVEFIDKKKIWTAYWKDNNKKTRTKSFSINKYGDLAHQKAIECRKQKEQEFYHQNK